MAENSATAEHPCARSTCRSPATSTRRREATADHRPATEVARDALAGWLQARQRERVAKEIHRFALDFAGTELDIDPDLEQAGVDHLLAGDAR